MRRLTAILLFGCASQAAAQDAPPRVIRGTVRDSSGAAVAYAVIQKTGQSRVVSDDSGHFEYRAPPRGDLTINVRRIGYRPFEVKLDPAGDTTIHIVLVPVPRQFDAVNVEATRLSRRLQAIGFYERLVDRNKGVGSGIFLTIEDIEQRNPLRITHMLDQMNGVRVQKVGAGYNDYVIQGPGRCNFTIYLNGSRLSPSLRGDITLIDNIVEPSAVAGIEVYPRATSAPSHLQMLNGTCGVVAFWTR